MIDFWNTHVYESLRSARHSLTFQTNTSLPTEIDL